MTLQSQTNVGGLPQNAPLDMVINFVNRLLIGRLNVTLDATLRASQTTTVLTDSRLGFTASIDETPLTASAATARASIWYSNFSKGSVTVNHASNAAADQKFRFKFIG